MERQFHTKDNCNRRELFQVLNPNPNVPFRPLYANNFQNMDINDLRELSDQIKANEQNLALVFAAESEGKVTFFVSLTDDVVSKGYHASKMIKEIAAAAGGGGGGKADMAQAGGKDPSKIHEALLIAENLL